MWRGGLPYMRQARGSLEIRDGACGFQAVEESGLNICWRVFGRNYRCRFNFPYQFFGFAGKPIESILAEELRMDSGTLKQSGA